MKASRLRHRHPSIRQLPPLADHPTNRHSRHRHSSANFRHWGLPTIRHHPVLGAPVRPCNHQGWKNQRLPKSFTLPWMRSLA